MKTKTLTYTLALVGTLGLGGLDMQAQRMTPEAHANIHELFTQHDKVQRTVEKTDNGYVATTESDDPRLAKVLQEHVRQMSDRLESGLMVRRWDPAFAEYVEHYKDLKHRFVKTKKGLRMTVTGKTPKAILVAQNHAAVVSEFAKDGWAAHDRSHAAVGAAKETTPKKGECCMGGAKGAQCGRPSSK